MVQRWAVANGNWSNTATWDGGTLPASGDDVYANNFTVTIDQNVVANSLKVIAGTTAVIGGQFQCSGTFTIALQSLDIGAYAGAGSLGYALLLSGGAVTLTVAGSISGDTATAANEPAAISITGGTHHITAGSVNGGAGVGISVSGGDSILDAAIQTTGTTSAVYVNTGGALEIRGSITGPSQAPPGQASVLVTGGIIRLDCALIYGPYGQAPIDSAHAIANKGIVFKRGGANLLVRGNSDDDWPLDTGAQIDLVEGGGGTPGRYLNVGGVATPIG